MRDKHPSVAFTCSQTRRKLKPRHVPTCNLSLCGARPITAPFPGGAELQGRLRPGGRGSGPGETCWSQRRVKTLALHRASETPSPCLSLIGEEWKVKKWRGGTVQRKACLLLPIPWAVGRARANVGAGVGAQWDLRAKCWHSVGEMEAHRPHSRKETGGQPLRPFCRNILGVRDLGPRYHREELRSEPRHSLTLDPSKCSRCLHCAVAPGAPWR